MTQQVSASNSHSAPGMTISENTQRNVESLVTKNEAVPDSSTDLLIGISIDVSTLQQFSMQSDVDMTVETNSGGSPQETFTLLAGVGVYWETGDVAIFAGDVTALYCTTGAVGAGILKVISAQN